MKFKTTIISIYLLILVVVGGGLAQKRSFSLFFVCFGIHKERFQNKVTILSDSFSLKLPIFLFKQPHY